MGAAALPAAERTCRDHQGGQSVVAGLGHGREAIHGRLVKCAVIGVADELKGQLPMGFLCLNKGCDREHGLVVEECVRLVRDWIGPVAAFRTALVVERLPKTRSGKIMRRLLRDIAEGKALGDTTTLADAAVVAKLKASYEEREV